MGCTFCSATNFLHEAQGSVAPDRPARCGRMCCTMIERIVAAHPTRAHHHFPGRHLRLHARTSAILPLCEAHRRREARGRIPSHLQFISTNRIDAMTSSGWAPCGAPASACWASGSRSFSRERAGRVQQGADPSPHRADADAALDVGVTPFLDLILSSPRATLEDVAETLRAGLPLAAAGLRDRHVPVCHSVLGRRVRAGSDARAAHDHARRAVSPARHLRGSSPRRFCPIDPAVARCHPAAGAQSSKRRCTPLKQRWPTCRRACARCCGFCVPADHGGARSARSRMSAKCGPSCTRVCQRRRGAAALRRGEAHDDRGGRLDGPARRLASARLLAGGSRSPLPMPGPSASRSSSSRSPT